MGDLNKKIVFTALSRLSNDRTVIKDAFLHWHNKLGDKPLDVFESVETIQNFLGLATAEKKILMVSMHSSTSKSESDLLSIPAFVFGDASPDAAPGSNVDDAPADVPASTKAPYIALAEFYFSELANGVQRAGGGKLKELQDILHEEGLPALSLVNDALKKVDDKVSLPKGLSEQDCQSFCHEMYLLVSEVIGPMAADDVSYKAIANLLNTNEASRYDPRKLI